MLYANLAPTNLVLRHRWLFNNHWVELPRRERDDKLSAKRDMLTEDRNAALTEILQSLGIAGIEDLLSTCAEPGTVGVTLATMNCTVVRWANWIAEKGVDFTPGLPTTWCISSMLRATPAPQSTQLLHEVISLGNQMGWGATKFASFLVLSRTEPATWQLATECGAETAAAYWENVQPDYWVAKDEATDFEFVLNHLLDAKRPRTALQCCQYDLSLVPAKLLFSLLQQFMAGHEQNGPLLDSWHIAKMLEHLENSGEIEKAELIQLEFGLFPALGYGQEARATALYNGIMADPALFTELICLIYKPEHGEREEPVTDATRTAAKCAYRVLHACTRQPGTQANGSIDRDAFNQFINGARDLCLQADRLTMCDQTLGQILAYAPTDDDGTWPCFLAREIMEQSEMEEMRRGFVIGTHNKRGVTTRSPCDGGEQERDLAADYRKQASLIRHSHPVFAATLEQIAKGYEREGTREDIEANLRKEEY